MDAREGVGEVGTRVWGRQRWVGGGGGAAEVGGSWSGRRPHGTDSRGPGAGVRGLWVPTRVRLWTLRPQKHALRSGPHDLWKADALFVHDTNTGKRTPLRSYDPARTFSSPLRMSTTSPRFCTKGVFLPGHSGTEDTFMPLENRE